MTNSYHKQIERCNKRGKNPPDYTLEDLHKRYLNDETFLSIYKQWADNGYKYYDYPSIDRVDNSKGYTLNNLQIMTWAQNRQKGDIENSHLTTEVLQYLMDGLFLRSFSSIKEAVKITGCHQGLISACCQGKRNQTGGYIWKYGDTKRK